MKKDYLKYIIFGGLFLVPFIPFLVSSSFFFPFITTKGFAWRVIVEIVFAVWLVLMLMAPEYRPKKSVIVYAFALFLVVIGLADIFGVAPLKSFWSNYERMEGYITLLHLGAYFIVMGSVFKELDWKRWWNTTLVASFLMVIYCGFQLAGLAQIHQGGARLDGTLGNASYLAVYMLFHIFIAILFLWRERKNVSKRFIYGALIILQSLVLYNTATRGAILGFLGGLLIIAILNVRNKNDLWLRRMSIALIAALVVIVGGFALVRNTAWVKNSLVLGRFATISTEELKSGGRSFVWPMAWKGVREHPILGWGQDNFNYVFNEHYDAKMYMLEPWFDRAHNIFLDWAVAGGLLGLLSYLSLYAAFLWVLWKGKNDFAYEERTIMTALLAAYFFHNLFVFDQLVSYLFFAALLAYVYSRTEAETFKASLVISPKMINTLALPVISIATLAVLYWGSVRPIIANTTLLGALPLLSSSADDQARAMSKFKTAYGESRLGRPEAVEQIASATAGLLSGQVPMEQKNNFYAFAKSAVVGQAEELSTDARYQILAGSFLVQTGSVDEGIIYLTRAQKLMPGKQLVYFELGSAYISKGDFQSAYAAFKKAYELAPEYLDAKKIYLFGAIYADDRATERLLISQLPEKDVLFDDRIMGAYYNKHRYADVIVLLNRRAALDPANAATYADYIRQVKAATGI